VNIRILNFVEYWKKQLRIMKATTPNLNWLHWKRSLQLTTMLWQLSEILKRL